MSQKINNQEFVQILQKFIFDNDFGPKIMQQRHVINFQKGATLLYTYLLMRYYNNYSTGCYLYLALHGSYGIIWLLKDFTFPDASWQKKSSITSLGIVSFGLVYYWILPLMMAYGYGEQSPSNKRIFTSIFCYAIGVVLMIASDCQKYYTLKYKKGLIDDGMFKYTRNPNYLGEIMVYLSFAICVGRWESYYIISSIWLTVFAINMMCKEISLKKKQGWEVYRKRSYMLLPKIKSSHALSLLTYVAGIYFGFKAYK